LTTKSQGDDERDRLSHLGARCVAHLPAETRAVAPLDLQLTDKHIFRRPKDDHDAGADRIDWRQIGGGGALEHECREGAFVQT
jgi:hypothetical protein